MKCLVSGSHGFVGRHFVKRLLDDGHDVVGVDDLSTGISLFNWPFPLPSGSPFEGHICDVRHFLLDPEVRGFDLVIHCAAVVGGRKKIEGDPIAVATDLAIDADFWNWCVRTRPGKIVYFSSSAVYPTEWQSARMLTRLSEGHQHFCSTTVGMPDQTYGWSKLTGELLAQHAVKTYDLDVVIYRPFSGYGEDQDPSYPFPAIIDRILRKEHPVIVWGNGNQCRDLIHIDDIVEAVLVTKDQLRPGEVLNLGTGIATSFRDLVTQACDLLGHRSVVSLQPEQPTGVFYRVADATKMLKLYLPKVSLAEGIQRVAKFRVDRLGEIV